MQSPQIRSPRVKEIIDHAEVLFRAERGTLGEKHEKALSAARFTARQTHNSGALVPVEAGCCFAHNRDLIVGYATSLAAAHTSFSEPAGRDADAVLSHFAALTVAGSRSGFVGRARLTAMRTGRSNSQVPLVAREFEGEAGRALAAGRRILDPQRVQMKNRPLTQPAIYSATGPNARITINGTDRSTNLTVGPSDEVFQKIRQELERLLPDNPSRAALIGGLGEVEQAPSRASAMERYERFVALAANHATVLSALSPSFIPLIHWLSTHPF
jgi:hypothetical protein